MADNYIGLRLAFDRGIDRVTYVRHGESEGLPLRQEGAPSELGGRQQLEALLDQPTLDQFLEDVLRPQLVNRDLMAPTRFQSVLDSLHEAINDKLGQDGGFMNDQMPQEKMRVLQRALRLLNSERDLRGLVQMYRSVLYQG